MLSHADSAVKIRHLPDMVNISLSVAGTKRVWPHILWHPAVLRLNLKWCGGKDSNECQSPSDPGESRDP